MFNSREADRVVNIFTKDGNKIAAVAKGIKKSTSRKAHAIDLLNLIDFKVSEGKGLPVITEVKLINGSSQFKQNYAGLTFTQCICELIDIFMTESHEDVAGFRNMANLLEVKNPERFMLLLSAMILRLLYLNGTLPDLDENQLSGEKFLEDEKRFDSREIGYVGSQSAIELEEISPRIIKTQKFILTHDFSTIHKLSLTAEEQLKMLQLHVRWLEIAMDKRLKTLPQFLEAIT